MVGFMLLSGLLLSVPVMAGTWSSTGSMGTASAGFKPVLLPDGKVLVVGGGNSSTDSSGLYDPATDTWGPAGHDSNVEWHTATLLNNGKVLVSGGQDIFDNLLDSCRLYDPASNSWSSTGSMSQARCQHSATLLADGRILVAGGTDDPDNFSNPPTISFAEIYDPATGTWGSSSSMSYPGRRKHSATALPDGRVLVVGGETPYDEFTLDDNSDTAEIYDPVSNQWAFTNPPSGRRIGHSATLLANGKVLVAGESNFGTSAEIFDPSTNQWAATGSLGTPRSDHVAVLLQSGDVLVAGGFASGTGALASAEIYDGPDVPSQTPFQIAVAAAGLIGNNALADAIPYHDGIPNLLKFAFGLNLAGPDTRRMQPGGDVGLPTAYLEDDGGTMFRIEFLRRKDSGLTYTPKKSSNLVMAAFNPLDRPGVASAVPGLPGWERVIIDEPHDPVAKPKLFVVVEVSED